MDDDDPEQSPRRPTIGSGCCLVRGRSRALLLGAGGAAAIAGSHFWRRNRLLPDAVFVTIAMLVWKISCRFLPGSLTAGSACRNCWVSPQPTVMTQHKVVPFDCRLCLTTAAKLIGDGTTAAWPPEAGQRLTPRVPRPGLARRPLYLIEGAFSDPGWFTRTSAGGGGDPPTSGATMKCQN